jgi:hypothetical protein
MIIICDRCGWFIPNDCTCRWHSDELARVRLRGKVEKRHRESVTRAHGADGGAGGSRERAAGRPA